MFIDIVNITVSSGRGGDGCASFRREKFVTKGGPDGGDGGRGGSVYFKVDNNSHTLSTFRGKKNIKAHNGKPGKGSNMHGKSGEDLIVNVPPGTLITNSDTKEPILDLKNHASKKLILKGGNGGFGNARFKNSINQRPTRANSGQNGKTLNITLELKLIADVGLVGFPNVGKSTLISTISDAKPQIANYEFTTLTPKLGCVKIDEKEGFDEFIMADIPGIIKGANEGKGLGIEFLRHIERTDVLLFMVDLGSYIDIKEQYKTLKDELKLFSEKLHKRRYAIVLSKCDLLIEDEIKEKYSDFMKFLELNSSNKIYMQNKNSYDEKKPYFVMPISSINKKDLIKLKQKIFEIISMN